MPTPTVTIRDRISALREADEFAYAHLIGSIEATAQQDPAVRAALLLAVEQVERCAGIGGKL